MAPENDLLTTDPILCVCVCGGGGGGVVEKFSVSHSLCKISEKYIINQYVYGVSCCYSS